MNLLQSLPKPFFVLAPMDDVTDSVFRQIVESCAPADLYMTEFTNVDGLCSPGRNKLMPRLRRAKSETKLIAQLWGKDPQNFETIAEELAWQGFVGIDINFGCPDKTVVRNKTCSAFILPENREAAVEIIQAVRRGIAKSGKQVMLSVKTRLGFNEVDLTWHELLLKQKVNMLTVHGRTKKQMSKVPADWDMIGKIRELRDQLAPDTLIVGNGDVKTRAKGLALAKKHKLDGVMIGRGIFDDPFCFAAKSPWLGMTKRQRVDLFRRHLELFAKTYPNGERRFDPLKKFAKIYISDFDGAKELREQIMQSHSVGEALAMLK